MDVFFNFSGQVRVGLDFMYNMGNVCMIFVDIGYDYLFLGVVGGQFYFFIDEVGVFFCLYIDFFLSGFFLWKVLSWWEVSRQVGDFKFKDQVILVLRALFGFVWFMMMVLRV